MRTTAHRLAAAALTVLLATVLSLSGCSNRGCTCPDEVEHVYPARTSPENVLEKLRLAYVNMDVDAYVDCLAEEFVFHLNPCDVGIDPEMPESWGKQDEEDIHEAMFADDSDVEGVTLTLTTANIEFEWNAGDSIWRYTEASDLRITLTYYLAFHASTPQLFVLAIDGDRAGPDGEELWAIVEWYDLEEEWHQLGVHCTWSSIKALYR